MSAFKKISETPHDILIKIISEETSKVAVLRRLGIAPTHSKCGKYLRDFITENNINIEHMSAANGLEHRYTKEDVERFVSQSLCWTDVIKATGREFYGNLIVPIKRLVKFYDIDTSHFIGKSIAASRNRVNTNTIPEEDIFCEHSKISRASLKRHILKNSIIEYKCYKCGCIGEWLGEPLILQIEHINGIRNDHRLENLCFLCANCHSQTATYAGRNWKKSQRVNN